jgi:CAAX protease family protein
MTTILTNDQYHPGQARALPVLEGEQEQYTLWQIFGIWAIVSLPMALLTWVVAPLIIPYSPLHPGITFWLLMIAGMTWQFAVALAILYRELGTFRWSLVRQRLWLQTPRDPATGQPNARFYWLLLPLMIYDGVVAMGLSGYLDAPMAWLFPTLQPPAFMDMSQLVNPVFRGQWWLLGIALISFAFNYFLGEALLWHGILLPRMRGVFGKYDWVANAVLFGLYHLHKPWALPTVILTNLAYSWPARRFRSNWMAVAVHGIEATPVLVLVLAVILGWTG